MSIVFEKRLLLTSLLTIFMTVPALGNIPQTKANICVEAKGTDIFLDIFTWLGNHPMFEEQSDGSLTFGDGIRGSRPKGNAKHDEEGGHVVFGDGKHGVLSILCEPVSVD